VKGTVKKAKQGIPPFGYRVRDGKLYQNNEEQKAIKMILNLRSEGKSIREICRHLTAAGIARRRKLPVLASSSRIEHPAKGIETRWMIRAAAN